MKTQEPAELRQLRDRITRRFHKACADYGLIADGDHILVGHSGGKDSLALVELLGKRSRIHVPAFRVTAAHVIVEDIGYQSDADYLARFCADHNVDFRLLTTRSNPAPTSSPSPAPAPTWDAGGAPALASSDALSQTAPAVASPDAGAPSLNIKGNPCFLCSWYRRKALFNLARQLGCNKLALGHHRDDIIQTLLLNLIYQGSISTIAPRMQMDKMPLQLIRPLCLIDETDLSRYAELVQYRRVPKLCPYEHESRRADVKRLLDQLQTLNPEVRDSIWGALHNVKPDYLPQRICPKH